MNFLDPANAADLWLLMLCGALIVVGVISVIWASKQAPPKRYYLNGCDHVATAKRVHKRNGYKSQIGAR
jgi:hypothetical protein